MDTSDAEKQAEAPSVRKAWAWLLVFTGGMTAAAFITWGTLSGAPGWFHTLYAAQTIWAIIGVTSAHKRRSEWEAAQRPV